jgi:hypothetical protein
MTWGDGYNREAGRVMRHACDKRSPDLAFGVPAGCSRTRQVFRSLKLRRSLNFHKLYIRPNWSVK